MGSQYRQIYAPVAVVGGQRGSQYSTISLVLINVILQASAPVAYVGRRDISGTLVVGKGTARCAALLCWSAFSVFSVAFPVFSSYVPPSSDLFPQLLFALSTFSNLVYVSFSQVRFS